MKTLVIRAGLLAILCLCPASEVYAQEKVTRDPTVTSSTRTDLEANQKDSSKIKSRQGSTLLVVEGGGIAGVRVGKSLLSDVIATYGEDYQLIEHKKYSWEARYPNRLSFFYCYADKRKKIVSLRVGVPSRASTLEGIIIGESTINDVFRIYGAIQAVTAEPHETWVFAYKGVQFHVKFDSWEDDDNLTLFQQRKVIAIVIEPTKRFGNPC